MSDDRGRRVTLEAPPQRIVSASLASDEVLIPLLTAAGALHRLAAVSYFADDPRYSNIAQVPAAIKERFDDGLERILARRPDLAILASFNKPETVDRLEASGVRCFVLGGFTTLDEITTNVLTIGRLIGLTREAETMAATFARVRQAVWMQAAALPRRPRVLGYLGDAAGNGALTLAARGSLFDALVEEAGGDNLATALGLHGWPTVSAEVLAGLEPDVIIASGDTTPEAVRKTLTIAPGWRSMQQLRKARIIVIPSRELAATSTFVAAALQKLVRGFQP